MELPKICFTSSSTVTYSNEVSADLSLFPTVLSVFSFLLPPLSRLGRFRPRAVTERSRPSVAGYRCMLTGTLGSVLVCVCVCVCVCVYVCVLSPDPDKSLPDYY